VRRKVLKIFLVVALLVPTIRGQIVALWLFDEQVGLYPSAVLNESSDNDYPMVLGWGGQIVPGKFGNALESAKQAAIDFPEGSVLFGLQAPEKKPGRIMEPLTWMNADFVGLMTSGENHLRKEVGFVKPTETKLNLGNFDWSVEFWLQLNSQHVAPGVIFEIGSGPRGENDFITRLSVDPAHNHFILNNQAGNVTILIPSGLTDKPADWHHCAFVYDANRRQLYHFLDGKLQSLPEKGLIKPLPLGEGDYFTVGCDGLWQQPLPGKIDELRFSTGQVYTHDFTPPGSFAPHYGMREGVDKLIRGQPLLFGTGTLSEGIVQLRDRKHLFIDNALIDTMEHITFRVNPPRLAEKVIDSINVPFRKHLTIIEDEDGLIRMYNGTYNNYLAVRTSTDGVHWNTPDVGNGEYKGMGNIVISEPTGMGSVFIDPNAPPERRWKYISDYHRRGIYLYSSKDGWSFYRHKTAILPFRSGSQSNIYYDDQQQIYVGHHRSDCLATPAGETLRSFVMTEVKDILNPWPFKPIYATNHEVYKLRDPQPWFLDNGPLTPGGFCQEYPMIFVPQDFDPLGTDIYVPKVEKYAWAPDVYVAFPILYFHYESDGPLTRQILMDIERQRGSGPVETQLAVSRDGVNWKRFGRPAYVGIGVHEGIDIHQAYLAHGMVRRGQEIWQYYYGTAEYHSTWIKKPMEKAVFRVVQRLDGFVSADTPYNHEGKIITKPLIFKGNRLLLNIDTDATGYIQVGFLNEAGKPIDGFRVEDCIYLNGDFVETEVEWLQSGKDISSQQGKIVRVVFKMRGSRLFAMQFSKR
jgi:hypothetical protein